ncbi:MAG TPA: hypothetical protein VIC05_00090 [Solirubrobacteraceae bacterium]
MAIIADWEHTDTNVRGVQTEVILPLSGLGAIHPAEDRVITNILRGLPQATNGSALWEKLKFDREGCRLHLFVADTPDVESIKRAVDGALETASGLIKQNMKQRESEEAQRRNQEDFRKRRAAALRESFRSH